MSRKTDGWRREAGKLLIRIADRDKDNDRDRLAAKMLLAAADAAEGVVAEESDPDQTP